MINIQRFFENHLSNREISAEDYFNQSLLEDPTRSQEEPPNTTPQA